MMSEPGMTLQPALVEQYPATVRMLADRLEHQLPVEDRSQTCRVCSHRSPGGSHHRNAQRARAAARFWNIGAPSAAVKEDLNVEIEHPVVAPAALTSCAHGNGRTSGA